MPTEYDESWSEEKSIVNNVKNEYQIYKQIKRKIN